MASRTIARKTADPDRDKQLRARARELVATVSAIEHLLPREHGDRPRVDKKTADVLDDAEKRLRPMLDSAFYEGIDYDTDMITGEPMAQTRESGAADPTAGAPADALSRRIPGDAGEQYDELHLRLAELRALADLMQLATEASEPEGETITTVAAKMFNTATEARKHLEKLWSAIGGAS